MADKSVPQTQGGQSTAAVAASGSGDVVVSAVPGRVCKLHITTAGTAALELYNHASASAGAQLVWKSPATTVLGETYHINVPVSLGIIAKRATNTPAYTVSFSADTVGTGPDKSVPVTRAGQYSSTHAAGAGGAGAALAAKGRLCSVIVLAQGTAVTDIHDHASAASGTKLFSVPASGTTAVAAGTVFEVEMPAANGIYVAGATNTSQILITYRKENAYGL